MKLYLEVRSLFFELRSVKSFNIAHLQLALIESSTVESNEDSVEEILKFPSELTRSLFKRDEPMLIQQNTSSMFSEKKLIENV